MTEINKNQKLSSVKNAFKNFSPSKTFIATTCVLLGVGTTLLAQNISKAHQPRDPFFNIFEEMAAIEQNMNQVFANHQKHMREIFAEVEKSGKASKSQVSTSEDNNNYYYELSFSGFKKEDISVQVKDHVLTLSATKNQDSEGSSSFHYSFLAPKSDVTKEPEIVRSDDKIVVRLGKKIGKS